MPTPTPTTAATTPTTAAATTMSERKLSTEFRGLNVELKLITGPRDGDHRGGIAVKVSMGSGDVKETTFDLLVHEVDGLSGHRQTIETVVWAVFTGNTSTVMDEILELLVVRG
jgi:hypothetical protein